jgi:hypothetical protein
MISKAVLPFLVLVNSLVFGQNPKTLQFIDTQYEAEIKTVRLHARDVVAGEFRPAVTKMGQWNLILEFDDLTTERDSYNARVIHCNSDWTPSGLRDLDYLTQYNEFPINSFEYSIDTHVPYVHYQFAVPPVKVSGNYLLVVYRGSDPDDIILSRRFMVYESLVTLARESNLVGGSLVASNQQLNFTLTYQNLELINPLDNVRVTIRQNERWDNLVTDVKPAFFRENFHELEYRFFDSEKMFNGGNEFRFFDLRSLNYPGRNVERVDPSSIPWTVYLFKEKTRAGERYSQYLDLNGSFSSANLDYRTNRASNYVNVVFTLASPTPVQDGRVYVTGAFSNWQLNETTLMQYDAIQKVYRNTQLLKQGWYDYQFVVQSPTVPYLYFESSHFETENVYEVFVYYRDYKRQNDLLIGYFVIPVNAR